MDYLIVLAVTVLIVAAVAVWALVHWRRTRRTGHDDLLRVGDEIDVTPAEASRRAEGEAAWTRISGGI
jgi:hypothetical protein